MNDQKQCRAPFIFVDKDGSCMIRSQGPFENKSEMERYVDLQECHCKKCRHWEVDEATDMGQCGFRAPLFFDKAGKCDEFAKQVEEPGFSTIVSIPQL
jgi:hypothetical protein